MARNKKFTVVGPHRVHETAPGESVTLDPSEPGTERLLTRGQIVPASSRQTDGAPTEDDPGLPASDESKE